MAAATKSKKADFSLLKKGVLEDNPVYSQALALCPVLAVTVSAVNGVGMGLSTAAVLVASCLIVSLLRKLIPQQVRIPILILICASFATGVQLFLQAFLPSIDNALGIFIPLIAVSCIIMARMEAFASKNNLLNTTLDSVGMGIGFTIALVLIGFVREFLGAGSIFGFELPSEFPRTVVMALPPGGFFVLGFLIVGFTAFRNKFFAKGKPKPARACVSKDSCGAIDCPEGGTK